MELLSEPPVPRPRTFVNAPPTGWIPKQQLLDESEIDEGIFADWAPKLGLRTCLVSRGRPGVTSYYALAAVATLKRLADLSQHPPRNMDRWLWQLWLEGHDVDVCAWAGKNLANGLKA
jgi:hypothetical protein